MKINFFEKAAPPKTSKSLKTIIFENSGIVIDDDTNVAMPTTSELLYAFQGAAEELFNRIAFLNGNEGLKANLASKWIVFMENNPSYLSDDVKKTGALSDSSILLGSTIVHSRGLAGLTKYRQNSKNARIRLEEDTAIFATAILCYIKNEESGFTSYFGPDSNSENKYGFGAFYEVIAPHLPQRTRNFISQRRASNIKNKPSF